MTPHATHESASDDTPDARTLTALVASGDEGAFVVFYRAWLEHVRRVVSSSLGHDDAVTDCTQEVFMRVIKKLPVLESDRAIGAWLTTTARRCAVDELRRRARRRRSTPASTERVEGAPERSPDLERAQALYTSSASELKDLIEARVRFGWTVERIGRAFGLTTSAADGRLRRAFERFRRTLEEGEAR